MHESLRARTEAGIISHHEGLIEEARALCTLGASERKVVERVT
ncbi:MAG: hypothetical protein JWN04_6479 [Myxococcaceae bacterium]|nr:hypothetical protein [Myxococcaceae bacterium]